MILETITIVGVFAMVATTLIGVLDRYFLGIGLPWPEELARFLLIWTSLLAAAVSAKHNGHFRLTFIYDRLGRKGAAFIDICCVVSMLIVAWQGLRLTMFFNAQTSPALGIPMSVVYAAVPVSAVLIAYYIARNLLTQLRFSTKADS